MTLTTLLIVFLVIFLFWGGFGYGRAAPQGPFVGAWSPLGFTAIVLLVLYLTGHLR